MPGSSRLVRRIYSAYFSPSAPRNAASSTFIRRTKATKIGTTTTAIATQFSNVIAQPTNASSTPVYDGCRIQRNGPRSTSSWSFSTTTSTVKNRPSVTIAHQRKISPATKKTTAKTEIHSLSGKSNSPTQPALSVLDCATNTPARMLITITTQIIPSVLLSWRSPVFVRERRVIVSSTSDAKKTNPSFAEKDMFRSSHPIDRFASGNWRRRLYWKTIRATTAG